MFFFVYFKQQKEIDNDIKLLKEAADFILSIQLPLLVSFYF